ncbi:hypothetical protein BDZ91DRAFT_784617 [Kalaharituber pfeilii]|nr:hypothetical protein BDZ91DRAFT_784617 [Kalaharituber pfeilii]
MRFPTSKRTAAAVAALLALTSPISADDSSQITTTEKSNITNAKSTIFGSSFSATCGCTLLSIYSFFGESEVFYSGSSTYASETQGQFWSQTLWTTPKCVFVPRTAKDVAKGVFIATLCRSEFGVRGGGHMVVPGYASTNDGILFGLSNFTSISLSADKTSVFVGPGLRWGQVYTFLQSEGLYVLGGRVAHVGVPGLLLGGGLNFFSNKYGFAMDNVKSYEVVLADATIVTASPTEHEDLFWALHGGANNFGIVTKFELKTHLINKMYAGFATFTGEANFEKFYSAIANFTNSGYDAKGAGLVPVTGWAPNSPPLGYHVFTHEGSDSNPAIFQEFDQITYDTADFAIRDPPVISQMLDDAGLMSATRHAFRVQASIASYEALKIADNTFFEYCNNLASLGITSMTFVGLVAQPIQNTTIEVAANNGAGGNSFGLSANDNYIWYVINLNWDDPAEDGPINTWLENMGNAMSKAFHDQNLVGNNGREFVYMNDAQAGQDAFASYGDAERQRLIEIRQQYDPDGKVFGKNGLCKGGFKLPV